MTTTSSTAPNSARYFTSAKLAFREDSTCFDRDDLVPDHFRSAAEMAVFEEAILTLLANDAEGTRTESDIRRELGGGRYTNHELPGVVFSLPKAFPLYSVLMALGFRVFHIRLANSTRHYATVVTL